MLPGLASIGGLATAAAAGSANFTNVRFLLGFEGADASTSFVDESSYARTVSAIGTGQIDTAQFKFGTSSLLCDESHNCGVSMADSPSLEIGTDVFRLDAWIRPTSGPNGTSNRENACICSKADTAGQIGWALEISSTFGLSFYYSSNGSSVSRISGSTPSNGAWSLATVSRDGSNVLRLFLNGVFQSKVTFASAFFDGTSAVRLGSRNATQYPLDAWGDDARLIIGTHADIITADTNFTPPVSAWPRS